MILWILLLIFAIILGVLLYQGNKVLNSYLYPPRFENKKSPKDFGLEYEEFNVQVDKKKIFAWFFKGKRDLTLIFVPGFITNRSFVLERVWPLLKKKEFNAVIFDPRGQGDSEGKFLMGAFMDEDVEAIINWLKTHKRLEKFVLFGTSLGATVALIVASKRKDVVATVADSPFMNVYKISSRTIFKISPFLVKFFLPFIQLIFLLKFRQDLFKKLNALAVADRVSHVFFIHGKNDKVYSYKHSLALYKKAKEPKKIWLTEANHCESYKLYPEEYLQRILEFIQSQAY